MAKSKSDAKASNEKLVSENRKARHDYEILETLECGVMLLGSEVKSLREGKVSLGEGYATMRGDALWLLQVDIPEYKQATLWNHEPKRARKLLLRKPQLRKFGAKSLEKGFSLVPLKLYFNERGIAKILLGLGKGKQTHDRRESIKSNDARREIDRAMKSKNRL